jgi:hypothetical protein
MKISQVAILAFAALFLLHPIASHGQQEYPNEVGLFLNEEGAGPHGVNTTALEPVTTYVVLLRPTDVDGPGGPEPLDLVQAFEFTLNFDNPSPLAVGNIIIPGGALNIGDISNFGLGYLEFIAALSVPRPVTNESVYLLSILFLPISVGVTEVTMGPVSSPSLPENMAYLAGSEIYPMYPISGSHDAPVFIFNGEAVVVENHSFGSVKGLYR